MGELLTVEEVADHLKVRTTTVRRWIRDGYLPAAKVGQAYRIRIEAVEALLQPEQP